MAVSTSMTTIFWSRVEVHGHIKTTECDIRVTENSIFAGMARPSPMHRTGANGNERHGWWRIREG
jgi:hypothetical protein